MDFTSVRMFAITKQNKTETEDEYSLGSGEIGTLVHFWWEYQMVRPL